MHNSVLRSNMTMGHGIATFLFFVVLMFSFEASSDSKGASSESRLIEGSFIGFDSVEMLKDFLPTEFWAHRDFFFFPGMKLEIGPEFRDYTPPEVYKNATKAFSNQVRLGDDGTLRDFRAGQPFPANSVSCEEDSDAGVKNIWNFVHRWQGFGARATFQYTYWDRGELRPVGYRGTTTAWQLKYRPEPQFEKNKGDVFPRETRAVVVGFELAEPAEARGTKTLTYRYASSYGPLDLAKPEDTWIYSREVRRVRKITQNQRASAVAGTDFSFDDLFSFSGLPVQYKWKCITKQPLLAPVNTRVLGYPYKNKGYYGPSGLSFANDRWELRNALLLEMVPRDQDHPYSKKLIWIDLHSFKPLYSFAYDRTGALWKIIYHKHRWSQDDHPGITAQDWYPGWDGVPEPRDLRTVSDAIVNVQTATGNRLDFYDSRGTPPNIRALRRYVDVRQLSRRLR